MTREELGRHFTQMKRHYFNATLCSRTFKIDSGNSIQFTSHIAATMAGALLAPSLSCEKHFHLRLFAVSRPPGNDSRHAMWILVTRVTLVRTRAVKFVDIFGTWFK